MEWIPVSPFARDYEYFKDEFVVRTGILSRSFNAPGVGETTMKNTKE